MKMKKWIRISTPGSVRNSKTTTATMQCNKYQNSKIPRYELSQRWFLQLALRSAHIFLDIFDKTLLVWLVGAMAEIEENN